MGKRPLAAALRYDTTRPAPFVVASGRGELAERLLDLARQYGIPVTEATELAERLVLLEPQATIPESLYEPVAAILAFVLDTDRLARTVGNEIEQQ